MDRTVLPRPYPVSKRVDRARPEPPPPHRGRRSRMQIVTRISCSALPEANLYYLPVAAVCPRVCPDNRLATPPRDSPTDPGSLPQRDHWHRQACQDRMAQAIRGRSPHSRPGPPRMLTDGLQKISRASCNVETHDCHRIGLLNWPCQDNDPECRIHGHVGLPDRVRRSRQDLSNPARQFLNVHSNPPFSTV